MHRKGLKGLWYFESSNIPLEASCCCCQGQSGHTPNIHTLSLCSFKVGPLFAMLTHHLAITVTVCSQRAVMQKSRPTVGNDNHNVRAINRLTGVYYWLQVYTVPSNIYLDTIYFQILDLTLSPLKPIFMC